MSECKSTADSIFELLVNISLFGEPGGRLIQQFVKTGDMNYRKQISVVQLADEILFLFLKLGKK